MRVRACVCVCVCVCGCVRGCVLTRADVWRQCKAGHKLERDTWRLVLSVVRDNLLVVCLGVRVCLRIHVGCVHHFACVLALECLRARLTHSRLLRDVQRQTPRMLQDDPPQRARVRRTAATRPRPIGACTECCFVCRVFSDSGVAQRNNVSCSRGCGMYVWAFFSCV